MILYTRDPIRWRTVISLLHTNDDADGRFNYWEGVENNCRWDSNDVKLADQDKALLLDAAAQAAALDPEPKVRARVGWTLGSLLKLMNVQKLPDYVRLRKLLETCAESEKHPEVQQRLKAIASAAPYKTIVDFMKNRQKFSWPGINASKDAHTKPALESANEF
jgi:hypothetical protein